MKKTYKIEVDCANCAEKMQEAAKKTEGVKDAVVNFMTLKMKVEFEEGADAKEVMQNVLANCKKGVDYESELAASVGQNETGYLFQLPKSNKRIIVLVTGLLRDFDAGTRSLTSFLRDFCNASDNNARYTLFCENVLLPYKKAFRQSFLYDIDNADQSADFEPNTVISETVLESGEPLFAALRTVFIGDNKLAQKMRDDLIFLTDSLYYALEKGDVKMIKAVWTGLKLALIGNKKAERKFSDISEFLALYALI